MGEWTKEPWSVHQDFVLTREGGEGGTMPMQEIHAGETPIARFTPPPSASAQEQGDD